MFKEQVYYYNDIKFCFDRLGSKTNLYVWVQFPRAIDPRTLVNTLTYPIKNDIVDWKMGLDIVEPELKIYIENTWKKILKLKSFW